jgi:hypothetical protein
MSFNRNRQSVGSIPQLYDGGFYYLNAETNGLDRGGTSASSYTKYAAYVNIKYPIFIKQVLWDLYAGTYELKIATISYGSNTVEVSTADVVWNINKILAGSLYFEITRTVSNKIDYVAGTTSYTGTYFDIPAYSYWNGSGYTNFAIPVKLVYKPIIFVEN